MGSSRDQKILLQILNKLFEILLSLYSKIWVIVYIMHWYQMRFHSAPPSKSPATKGTFVVFLFEVDFSIMCV